MRGFSTRLSLCGTRQTAKTATAAVLVVAGASVTPLVCARRCYYWPYSEDFVPAGAETSRFQSSSVPSVRERVVREYAFAPLFGARQPCCVLGFAAPAREVMRVKPELRAVLAGLLSSGRHPGAAVVELGPLRQAKEMLVYRGGTDESAPLGDSSLLAQTRRSTYARQPIVARTTVEVFLSEEEEEGEDGEAEGEEDGQARGRALHEFFYAGDTSAAHDDATGGSSNNNSNNNEEEEEGEREDDALALTVPELVETLRELGVVYCEVPRPDESGFVFDQLHGKEVDGELEERVVERWAKRLEMLSMAFEAEERKRGEAEGRKAE